MSSRGPFRPRLFYDSLIPSGLSCSGHGEIHFTLDLCQENSKALQLAWKCLFVWYKLPHGSMYVSRTTEPPSQAAQGGEGPKMAAYTAKSC